VSFEIDVESCPGYFSQIHSYDDESLVYIQYVMCVCLCFVMGTIHITKSDEGK
jgi:hypothetical protein